MVIDVKTAHFVPECDGHVYVELPEEAEVEEDECGQLVYWLDGHVRAEQAWEDRYSDILRNVGFKRALSSPVAFYRAGRDLWSVVRGDDFAFTDLDADVDFALQELVKHYEVKSRGRVGSGPKAVKETDVLGRTVRLHEWGASWEADARHREIILKHFGLEEGRKP